jgi:SAM-dependent methyltransferase
MDAPWRDAVAEVWALGDYASIAPLIAAPAARLVDSLGDGHGRSALDLGTGTGTVALALARRGWAVHAVDVCGPLLEAARRASEADGVVVAWHHAAMEDVPLADQSVHASVSSLGTMFALDPTVVVDEVRRCTRPGGLFAFTAVPRTGVVGEMAAVMRDYLPQAPAGTPDPFDWADDEAIRTWLSDGFDEFGSDRHVVPWTFQTPSLGIDRLFEASPLHAAAERMIPAQAADMRRELARVLEARANGNRVPIEFTLTTATRS